MSDNSLYLAAGLQSGGTTLLSWCFLQRRDMDGILDLPFDQLIDMPAHAAPVSWCKMTVASFRWQDVADHYGFQGFQVLPLLIVRDVRDAYASLKHKEYGRNGTTAEDPPLRLRLLRFLRDWQQFHANGWPILRFESLLADPENVLRDTCSALGLSWDTGMMDWPKPGTQLCDISRGNETFWMTEQTGGLRGAIESQVVRAPVLNRAEAEWLDETFAAYNQANDYPAHAVTAELPEGEFQRPAFVLSNRKRLFDRIAAQDAELAESHLFRGRLVSRLINAFPYPRKMRRALRGHPDRLQRETEE